MRQSEVWHRAESSPQVELAVRIDENSYSWLLSESDRTGVPVEAVASAVMRRACFEQVPIGAPDRD